MKHIIQLLHKKAPGRAMASSAQRVALKLSVAASLLVSPWTESAWAQPVVYVVVSARSPVKTVSEKDVLALFTGRSRSLNSAEPMTPIDQQRDGAAREAFYQALTGMDISRINSYWARLHFTGQVQPPQTLADNQSVILRLRSDARAVGYLTEEPTDPSVRVVLRLP
jgi:hypothetical protein